VKSARFAEFALVSLVREVLSAAIIVLAAIHLVLCRLRGDTRLERSNPRLMCMFVHLAERVGKKYQMDTEE
jgi:hypothetical protein